MITKQSPVYTESKIIQIYTYSANMKISNSEEATETMQNILASVVLFVLFFYLKIFHEFFF